MANNLQDTALLVLIFSSCSPSPYTPVGPVSLLSSPPNAPISMSAVFLLIGQAPASLAGSPAVAALFKISVLVFLSFQSWPFFHRVGFLSQNCCHSPFCLFNGLFCPLFFACSGCLPPLLQRLKRFFMTPWSSLWSRRRVVLFGGGF